eukprot:TRINITY_DN8097_c0_g1_i1.p1 TRINITY_DN8097_c0_g1~~TRINITY_DN8097_c0_g1_i1.p1  ORF type:complete len:469 (+),score=73.86 TRINITY_DN8097_c0_g1_i1:317-1723(+)
MMIKHPNVVRLMEVLASKTKIYLVLEYISSGELYDRIQEKEKLDEDTMRRYFRQIISAIDYCKSKNIAHRDLKPENILVCTDGTIKVSDFGLSSLYKDPTNITNMLLTTCGTINYIAPEVIQNTGYDGHLADVWSLGVILFYGCSGYLPFEDDNIARLLDRIVTARYEFPKHVSKSFKDLVSGVLNPNPKKRLNLQDIMMHPWFNQGISEKELREYEEERLAALAASNPGPASLPLIQNISSKSPQMTSGSTQRMRGSGFFSGNASNVNQPRSSQFGSSFGESLPSLQLTSFKSENGHEVRSIQSILTPRPRKINAFEMTSFLCGLFLNRIFEIESNPNRAQKNGGTRKSSSPDQRGGQQNSSGNLTDLLHFVSESSFETIFQTIKGAVERRSPAFIEFLDPSSGFKLLFGLKDKKSTIVVIAEIMEIRENLYLVDFSKQEGDQERFRHLYTSIYEEIKHIVRKRGSP